MIKVNGENIEIEKINLLKLIEEKKFNPKRIAVEINGEIIKRGTYADTEINNGDKVEIVCFVGGG